MELLGNPGMGAYSARPYARNIWDLQTFDGRLYIGDGNSSNLDPDPNAGPVDLYYWMPEGTGFVNHFTIEDEQVDVFRVIDGSLYIPCHDPLETWAILPRCCPTLPSDGQGA